MELTKYPRTQHLAGSRLQLGDEDLEIVPQSHLVGRYVVIEEKIDGANTGISFAAEDDLRLQSRGHYLTGGPRETQFTLFKQWAATFAEELYLALGERYIAYGEWLYSKHTVFYDTLPHYWLEFDVYDRVRSASEGIAWFLSTSERRKVLRGLPVVSVPVLWEGVWERKMSLEGMIRRSLYKSERWRKALADRARAEGQSQEYVKWHTDPSDLAEGLYIKVEEAGRVVERYKFVRRDFVSLLVSNDEHHLDRAMITNGLAPDVDLFDPNPPDERGNG